MIPDFKGLTSVKKQGRRNLVTLEQLDSGEIVTIKFILKSDQDVEFYTTVKEWNSKKF